jgi:hypothetical protein
VCELYINAGKITKFWYLYIFDVLLYDGLNELYKRQIFMV